MENKMQNRPFLLDHQFLCQAEMLPKSSYIVRLQKVKVLTGTQILKAGFISIYCWLKRLFAFYILSKSQVDGTNEIKPIGGYKYGKLCA